MKRNDILMYIKNNYSQYSRIIIKAEPLHPYTMYGEHSLTDKIEEIFVTQELHDMITKVYSQAVSVILQINPIVWKETVQHIFPTSAIEGEK